MKRSERERMNKLSKRWLGSATRWQKLLTKGVNVPISEATRAESKYKDSVCNGNKFTKNKNFQVPVFVKKYYSLDELKALFHDREEALAKEKEKHATIERVKEHGTGISTEKTFNSRPIV